MSWEYKQLTCPVCEHSFQRTVAYIAKCKKEPTCSYSCASVQRDTGTWTACQCCKRTMYRPRKLALVGMGKFCSRKCEAASRPNGPVQRTCAQCGQQFQKDYHSVMRVKNGGMFCTRACTDRYKRKMRKRGEQEMFTGWQKREWIDTHCAKCNSNKRLELDHRIPRFAGGKATQENAQTLCRTCNRKKFWTDDYPLYQEMLRQRASTLVD